MLPARLVTPRLHLRPLAEGDRTAVIAALSDWEVARWLRPVPWPYAETDFDALLAGARDGAVWAVDDGAGLAGVVGLSQAEGGARLGYWIAPGRAGRGYATEAAAAVVAATDTALPHLPVVSYHFEGNAASGRVLMKLGLAETGRTMVFARPHGREMPAVTFARPARVPVRDAQQEDLPAIRDIYNAAVRDTTAIWNEVEVDLANRMAWWQARRALGYPVLVAEVGGTVAGYASFGDWRAFDGYRATVEHSVYVDVGARGRGAGRALLLALADRARGCGKHVMVGAVEAGNAASLALHRSVGFREAGVMRQVGQKFGRWLDLAWVELVLDERPAP